MAIHQLFTLIYCLTLLYPLVQPYQCLAEAVASLKGPSSVSSNTESACHCTVG